MILSQEDISLKNLKYKIGTKFIFKQESLETKEYESGLIEVLREQSSVLEVISYEISKNDILYKLRFVIPDNFDWFWYLPEDVLDSDFVNLGKDTKNIRFILND